MNAAKKIAKYLDKSPASTDAQILRRLVNNVINDKPFRLKALYDLSYDNFDLALAFLKDWRLDRYTKAKERLRELVQQPSSIDTPPISADTGTRGVPEPAESNADTPPSA